MKAFIKQILASTMGVIIAISIICLAVIILIIAASSVANKATNMPITAKEKVLVIDLGMNINDSPPDESTSDVVENILTSGKPRVFLLEILQAIHNATADKDITALFIHGNLTPEGYGSGYATLNEIRDSIDSFKQSGKQVIAYCIDPSIKDYYLCSAADKIILNPFGSISLNGLSANMMFLAKALDKYGIGIQVVRTGRYKSAVEMFTRKNMSKENREQIEALIHSLWNNVISDIAISRNLDKASLIKYTKTTGMFTAEEALQNKLVDKTAYLDEVIEELIPLSSEDKSTHSFAQISLAKYIKIKSKHNYRTSENNIAVIYAEGEIVDGEGYMGQCGGDKIARYLRELRQDKDIAAIVLRVNSPGGSALASEKIQREMILARESKPTVVSMGSYAASGGYWISAYANTIFAQAETVTGSIGVFGLIPNIKEISNEHGITWDGAKTSPFADISTMSRPKTPEEINLYSKFVNMIYSAFINKVADARKMPIKAVDEIAQGRVWSGEDAHRLGLADKIGGLQDAIRHAVELAGISEDWTVIEYPEKKTVAEQFLKALADAEQLTPMSDIKKDSISHLIDDFDEFHILIKSFNDPKCTYTRLPFLLKIE